MHFINRYSFLAIIFLFVIPKGTISQSKKINSSDYHATHHLQDSIFEYKVSAFFVDKALKAHYTIQTSGKSFESIMEILDKRRNGLGIIIEKVWIVKKNRKEILLQNVPPEFRRETDSLLAIYRTKRSY